MNRPNVILITADQHPWDCLGIAGEGNIRTPHLDALARHGAWFREAVAPGDGAEAALGSLLALRVVGGEDESQLVRGLGDCGYDSAAAGVSAVGGSGSSIGFRIFEMVAPAEGDAGAARKYETVSEAIRLIHAFSEPFFLWLSLAPRNVTAASSIPGIAAARHRAAAERVDRSIGRVLATLSARGFTNNVVVYTACRGGSDRSSAEGEAVRVPLIISGVRGQRAGGKGLGGRVSVADIAPTILETVGSSTGLVLSGTSLVPRLCGGEVEA